MKVVFPGPEKLLKLCRMSDPNATREQNSGKQHRRANVECAEGVIYTVRDSALGDRKMLER